jgi:hypothetical protein
MILRSLVGQGRGTNPFQLIPSSSGAYWTCAGQCRQLSKNLLSNILGPALKAPANLLMAEL